MRLIPFWQITMAPGWSSPPAPGAPASTAATDTTTDTDAVAAGAYHPHLPEATTTTTVPGLGLFQSHSPVSPKPDPALVRRKPLPPTASPAIPTQHPRRSGPSTSSASSLYSNRSSQADLPPRSSFPVPHSRGSSFANSLSSPVSGSAPSSARGDASLFARRNPERYVTIALLLLSTP